MLQVPGVGGRVGAGMSDSPNVKIAEWLGWKWVTPPKHRKSDYMAMWDPYWTDETSNSVGCPRFATSDAAAIALFPVLVKKGFTPLLHRHADGWYVQIWGG